MVNGLNQTFLEILFKSDIGADKYIFKVGSYIASNTLRNEQKEALIDYFKHVLSGREQIQPKYMETIFRVLREFGAIIKKPYELVEKEDFLDYYDTIITKRNIKQNTIETYENIIRRFYSYYFEKLKKLGHWRQLEVKVILIFKSDLIKERLNVDYIQHERDRRLKTVYRYLRSHLLLEEQKQVLNDYYKYLASGSGKSVSVHCICANFRTLHQFGAFIKKPFNGVENKDLINYFYDLQRRKVSISTLKSYKHIIKKFYKFLHYGYLDPKQEYPEIVRWIELDRIRVRKSEEEMLTPEEIKRIVENLDHPRDRCLVKVVYDGALRKSEAINIKIKNIKLKSDHAFVTVNGKTGERRVVLTDSFPYIIKLLDMHPFKDNPEAYLFLNKKQMGSKLMGGGIAKALKKGAKLAQIKKKVYPHLLRHSKLTELAKNGYNERDLRIFAGWSSDSKMPDTYLHYGEEHVNNKILSDKGLIDDKTKNNKENILKPKTCLKCKKINPATSSYCDCGMALDVQTIINEEEIMNQETNKTFQLLLEIAQNPEMMKKFEEFKRNFKE